MPTAHGTEPTAMPLNPLPVNSTLDPAICITTVQLRVPATEWQTGDKWRYLFLNYDPMEVLTCLPLLGLVIQGEVRLVAYRLRSLECWSYWQRNRGHNSVLMQLQKLYPIFNIGVNGLSSAFNLELKYRVIMLTRELWTRGPRTLPAVKGHVWYTDVSRTMGRIQGWCLCGQSLGRRLSISLGK